MMNWQHLHTLTFTQGNAGLSAASSWTFSLYQKWWNPSRGWIHHYVEACCRPLFLHLVWFDFVGETIRDETWEKTPFEMTIHKIHTCCVARGSRRLCYLQQFLDARDFIVLMIKIRMVVGIDCTVIHACDVHRKRCVLIVFSGFIFYTHSIWPWSIKGNIRVSGCFIFD